MKTLIIGSSDGIGLATARLLIDSGFSVYGASKSMSDDEFPQFLTDVRDPDAIAATLAKVGSLDALVYCAGIGLASPAAETTRKDYCNLFEVNLFGLFECVKHALPRMSAGGKIIAVSSMAGVLPVPFNSYYNASKAAINSYILSLAHELKPLSITATAVLPGGTRTEFSQKRKKYSSDDADYADALHDSIAHLTSVEQHGDEPSKVAESILDVLVNPNPPLILPVGNNKAYYLLQKILPKKLTNRIIEGRYLQ